MSNRFGLRRGSGARTLKSWVWTPLLPVVFSMSLLAAEDPFDGFAERIEAERKAWGAPGLAIAIVHKDGIALMAGMGVSDVSTGRPVDENTLFHVGSTTKAFAAAALGLLVEDGKIAWDDKVVQHLPQFRVSDPFVTRELTIIDLLTHRSGVQNTDQLWVRGVTSDRFLPRLVHARQSSSLRSRFEYNNGMYVVAGKVIESVSGKSFTDFVRERLFHPLGMERTTGPLAEISQRDNVAMSHERIDGEMTSIGLTDMYDAGAAGLFYSSVSDYVNWLRIWLNFGKLEDRVILKSETVKAAFAPRMILPEPLYPAARIAGVDLFAYGLGWFVHQYRGRRVNMHTGSIDGMSAIVGLMPEEKLGVVAFINADHIELRHALMYETFDRVLGGPTRDWSGELRAVYESMAESARARRAMFERENPRSGDAPPIELRYYAGRYEDPLFGELEVVEEEQGLTMSASPSLELHMKPVGGHRFLAYRLRKGFEDAVAAKKYKSPIRVEFELGGDNRPKRLLFLGVAYERSRK